MSIPMYVHATHFFRDVSHIFYEIRTLTAFLALGTTYYRSLHAPVFDKNTHSICLYV